MGCFGSRLDKRASAATESFNSVGLQFHGGEGSPEWKLAADNFVVLQGTDGKYQELTGLYPTEGGKATEAAKDAAEKAFIAAFKWVEAQLKEHKELLPKDSKPAIIGGKFLRADVVDQLTKVLDKFKETGIEVPADAPATTDKPATDPATDPAADPATDPAAGGMEGGESEDDLQFEGEAEPEAGAEPEKAPEGMAKEDPRAKSTDDQEYKGFESTPALYLRTAIVSEFFGDSIKQRIIGIEFTGEKGTKINEQLAGAAGFLCSGLHTSERETAEAFFSGLVGELDEASLKALKDKDAISFPGYMAGWATEAEALQYLNVLKSDEKKDVKAVLYKVTGCSFTKVLGNRVAAYRVRGALSADAAYDEKENRTTITVAAAAYDDRTLQASADELKKPVEDAAKTAPAATDPAANPDPAPEAKPEGAE